MADILDAAQTNTPASPLTTAPVEPPPVPPVPPTPPATNSDSLVVPPLPAEVPGDAGTKEGPPMEKPASPSQGGPKKKSRLGVLLAGLLLLVITLPILVIFVKQQVEIRSRAAGACIAIPTGFSSTQTQMNLFCNSLQGYAYNSTTGQCCPAAPTGALGSACSYLNKSGNCSLSSDCDRGTKDFGAGNGCTGVLGCCVPKTPTPPPAPLPACYYCQSGTCRHTISTCDPSKNQCSGIGSDAPCRITTPGACVAVHSSYTSTLALKNTYCNSLQGYAYDSTTGQCCPSTSAPPTTTILPGPCQYSCNYTAAQCATAGGTQSPYACPSNSGNVCCNAPTTTTTPSITCGALYENCCGSYPNGRCNSGLYCSNIDNGICKTRPTAGTTTVPSTTTTPGGGGTTPGTCTLAQNIGCTTTIPPGSDGCIKYTCPQGDTNKDGNCDLRDTQASQQSYPGAGCPNVSCGNDCCQIEYTKGGQFIKDTCGNIIGSGDYYMMCKELKLNCSVTTGTPPPPQCINIIAYKDGNALSQAELNALQPGDMITLAFAPGGAATKVRFRVNAGSWNETTTKNGNGQFTWNYTLENATSFSIEAQWFDGSAWH